MEARGNTYTHTYMHVYSLPVCTCSGTTSALLYQQSLHPSYQATLQTDFLNKDTQTLVCENSEDNLKTLSSQSLFLYTVVILADITIYTK